MQLAEHSWVKFVEADLVLFTLPQEPSDADMSSLCAALSAWLPARNDFYAFVTDTRLLTKSKMAHRKQLSRTLASLTEHSTRWCAGNAQVLDSTMASAIVAAYRVLTRPKYPEKRFVRLSDAIEWARSQLQAFNACKKK